jgi:HK97 family phage portal protein
MGVIDWVRWAFSSKNTIYLNSCDFDELLKGVYYKELAVNSAINLIAHAIANSEFKTFEANKEAKQSSYYLFNVEPNQNQNATEFWIKALSKLINDNECLIVQQNSYLYVADSYDTKEKALTNSVFSNVVIGDLTFRKPFSASDVIFLKFNNAKMTTFIDGLYADYGKLINQIIIDYQKRAGIRGKLKLSTMFSQKHEDQTELQEYIKRKFSTYFTAINAVLPLEDGFDFTEESKQDNNINSDEVTKLINYVFDLVATALNIPKGIIKGDLAEVKEQTKNFLTFCVDPIAKLIQDEINRKYYKKDSYLKGTCLKIDTSRVEHINIFDIAGSLDVLTRIGFSPNELRKLVDMETIDETWANKHYITKNYQSEEGGDGNGKK